MKNFILFPILMIMLAFPAFVFSQTTDYKVVYSDNNGKYTFGVTQVNGAPIPHNTLVYYRFSDGYTFSKTSISNANITTNADVTRGFNTIGNKQVSAYILPKGGPAGYTSLKAGYASLTLNVNQISNTPNTDIKMSNSCLDVSHSWHPFSRPDGFPSVSDKVGGTTFSTPSKSWFYLDVTNNISEGGKITVTYDETRLIPERIIVQNTTVPIMSTQTNISNSNSSWITSIIKTNGIAINTGKVDITFPAKTTTRQQHYLILFKAGPEGVIHKEYDRFNFEVTQTSANTSCTVNHSVSALGTPHDPNHTSVNPTETCYSQLHEEPWTYRVYFQNEGTAPAENVIVNFFTNFDAMDLNTVTLKESSHPITSYTISGFDNPAADMALPTYVDGSQIQFDFKDIQLPGSNQTNPEIPYDQTEGWVEFLITPQPCLNTGEVNSYSTITFTAEPDFVESMHTNTANTLIVSTDSNGNDCFKECPYSYRPGQKQDNHFRTKTLTVTPNPFTDQFTIQWPDGSDIQQETPVFQIMDATGRTCMLINWSEGQTQQQVDLSGFPAGMYLLYAPTKENGIAVTKIIKQ